MDLELNRYLKGEDLPDTTFRNKDTDKNGIIVAILDVNIKPGEELPESFKNRKDRYELTVESESDGIKGIWTANDTSLIAIGKKYGTKSIEVNWVGKHVLLYKISLQINKQWKQVIYGEPVHDNNNVQKKEDVKSFM